MTVHMLTTVDNPYNPFTENDEWTAWDMAMGYHTNSYLARIVRLSNSLSEADQEAEIERAIEEVVQENVLGIYKKVPKPVSATA